MFQLFQVKIVRQLTVIASGTYHQLKLHSIISCDINKIIYFRIIVFSEYKSIILMNDPFLT